MNIGVIGAGAFALFATKAFLQVKEVKIIAVFDINTSAAQSMAQEVKAIAYDDITTFLENKEIDLVYIATPPFLHYQQSKMALEADKHVICEKPAALKTKEAEELQALASAMNKLYVVNLMQRYNPLYAIIKSIIDAKMMGNFLHGFFENYASDENLNEQHWFWNEGESGGIFIEHGVHFFDMFSGWLGKGKLVSSVQLQRPNTSTKIIDRVQATVLYSWGIVNFYHGFDQPKLLDRQEMKLQFERGDITLYGWVPVKMKLNALLKKENTTALRRMLVDSSTQIETKTNDRNKGVRGRFTDIDFDEEVKMEWGSIENKQNVYTELLQRMLHDQIKWIKNKTHVRVITDKNAVDSLQMAEEATINAHKF